jgi:DNA-3-methyladenine glycosylase II
VVDAISHLVSVEPKFVPLLEKFGIPSIYVNQKGENDFILKPFSAFHSLVRTVIGQQLNGKVADTIFNKFVKAVGCDQDELLSVEAVTNATFEVLYIDGKKKIGVNGEQPGLSEAKMIAIKSLGEHFSTPGLLKNVNLFELDDSDLFTKLTCVKGLGPWSVNMFSMFVLQRANVFPEGDLAVRRGTWAMYGYKDTKANVKALPSPSKLAANWQPYSSLGSMLMYKYMDDQKGKKV